jgi:2-polyprenyl-6-methoxyphenol hydroxylase-like FAD-dependent oxidoreductase
VATSSSTERVVVVGGGVGGLAAALAFGRAGYPVTLLERDPLPPTADAEEAFAAERRGAPQAHQTHGFLARVAVLLRERFPDVLDDLKAVGCTTLPFLPNLGEPRPGDEDLAVLVVRRTTFEWVLRQAVTRESTVDFRTGVGVRGLTAALPGVIDGVALEDGSHVSGDIVIASTGRRGDVPRWLGDRGIEVPETVRESGLMYLTRWYRLPPDLELDMAKLGGDLGFVKYLAVPGDAHTLSVTLAIRPDDSELRAALSDPDHFEAACRALPGPDQFFTNGPLEPFGGVRPMGGLLNRIRRFTDEDGKPTVLGFHAIGDAHTCTNPLYGRGCSLAMVQAVLLADASIAHPNDATQRAIAYELACKREVEPWFEVSVQMDKAGADPTGFVPSDGSGNRMAALFVAAQTDPIIGRGLARFWNLLSTPAEMMTDAELLTRMAEVMAEPDAYPVPPRVGPTREELLGTLAASPV